MKRALGLRKEPGGLPNEGLGVGDGLPGGGGTAEPLHPQPSRLYPDHSPPRVVLVCEDCEVYYEHKPGWEHCPKCAAELLEVIEA